jgi:hemerythrin-like domain-containing protein
MRRSTDNLRSDHVVVERALLVLRAIGAHVAADGAFPAADCALVLRFLREFVIAVHLRKESLHVLPAIAMHANHRAAQAVGDALRVHGEIEELVHSLVMFWEPTTELSTAEREGFAETVEAVVVRLRRLQATEEAELFPACDREVPVDDQLAWATEFARIEAGRASSRTWHERLAPLVANWLA